MRSSLNRFLFSFVPSSNPLVVGYDDAGASGDVAGSAGDQGAEGSAGTNLPGDGAGDGGDGGGSDGGGGSSTPPNPNAGDTGQVFTQSQLNEILAKERRKTQRELSEVQTQLQTLEQTAQLTEQQREELAKSRQQLEQQLMSKEQLAAKQRKTLQEKHAQDLAAANLRAEQAEAKYADATIRRQLTDAAVEADAFNPSQVVALLRNGTELVDGNPVVTMEIIGADEKPTKIAVSPTEAVKQMSEMTTEYGNLFRNHVVGGIGGGATDGFKPQTGKLDVSKMSPEEYFEARKSDPKSVGLG